jgi:hypothetical protein
MIDEALAPLFLFTTIVLRIAGAAVVTLGMDPGHVFGEARLG